MSASFERNSQHLLEDSVMQSTASGTPQQWSGPKFKPGEWVKVEALPGNKLILPAPSEAPTGLKFDKDKSRVDLLDPEFLMAMGMVMGFGATKYSADNWRGGIMVRRLLASALRHIFAICRGEDIDPESGAPHTAHLGCCVMMLHWMLKHKPELDDRFKY